MSELLTTKQLRVMLEQVERLHRGEDLLFITRDKPRIHLLLSNGKRVGLIRPRYSSGYLYYEMELFDSHTAFTLDKDGKGFHNGMAV